MRPSPDTRLPSCRRRDAVRGRGSQQGPQLLRPLLAGEGRAPTDRRDGPWTRGGHRSKSRRLSCYEPRGEGGGGPTVNDRVDAVQWIGARRRRVATGHAAAYPSPLRQAPRRANRPVQAILQSDPPGRASAASAVVASLQDAQSPRAFLTTNLMRRYRPRWTPPSAQVQAAPRSPMMV